MVNTCGLLAKGLADHGLSATDIARSAATNKSFFINIVKGAVRTLLPPRLIPQIAEVLAIDPKQLQLSHNNENILRTLPAPVYQSLQQQLVNYASTHLFNATGDGSTEIFPFEGNRDLFLAWLNHTLGAHHKRDVVFEIYKEKYPSKVHVAEASLDEIKQRMVTLECLLPLIKSITFDDTSVVLRLVTPTWPMKQDAGITPEIQERRV